MLEIWDLVGEVNIKELLGNHFLFTFGRTEDKEKEPDGTVAPSKTNLKFVDFWVQIRNVPLLKMTEKLARSIRDRIGKCIDTSRSEGGELVGGFMRIRVQIDTTKPLWRGLRITFPRGSTDLVAFVYEKLPKLCFGCGKIGHIFQDCNYVPEQQKRATYQPYGRFLTLRGYGHAQSSNSQSYDSISEEEEENRGNKRNSDAGKQKNVPREFSDAVSSPTKKKQTSSLEVSNKIQAVSSQL
ncbi:hypothetical protein PRUPE_2G099000 [Prunus persica]|uniref:CCHC-type domain-containing protein n=1 Tax=Prunus persica TaxID=3760 RepID=A0A251QDQ1_PRUPE|nr:hypothetical protein PRUPE_2G099000 [Prunus persica]